MKKAVFTQKYSCGQLLTCCGFGLVSLCLNNSHAAWNWSLRIECFFADPIGAIFRFYA